MSVVGIDLGNKSCVVAVARRGVIDTLQNEVGNRKTAALVGYQNQRFIGDEASSQANSNYKNTFNFFKRFLAGKTADPEMAKEKDQTYFETTDQDGRVAFKVKYDGKNEVLTPEQVTAAMLFKLRQISEAGLDAKVTDVVIGVPLYWNDEQRRALLDAAGLAGLNVLRLMNETTAVALTYGLLRPLPKDETKIVTFVDVGECSTCVSVVSFVTGKLKVLGTASHSNLGGRDFDQLLVDHFVAYVKEKYKMDVTTNPKSMMKMWKECERVKRILSANTKVVFAIEYLMNDTDVKGEVTRDEFEALCKEKITANFQKVCAEAMSNAGVTVDQLHAVEVVGGAIRIPILQQELSAFFGKDVSKTCDGDESVARGCALQCAMLSPSVKVREFEVQDVTQYPIEVAWGAVGGELEDSSILFDKGNAFPCVKCISFKERTQPFQLIARYSELNTMSASSPNPIAKFNISGMPSQVPEGALAPPKIKVKVQMSIHGTIDISQAQVVTAFEEKVETPAPAAEPEKDEDSEMKEADKKPDDTGKDGKQDGKEDSKEENAGKDASKDATKDAMDTTEDPKPAEEPKTKKVNKREPLSVERFLTGLSKAATQAAFERESAMAHADKVIFDTNFARNALESYVLEQRVRISEQLKDFVEPSICDKFCEDCRNTEDWLYDEGEDAQKSEYVSRLDALKKIGDAVEFRSSESEARPQYIEALEKEVVQWQTWTATTDEKYAHITAEDRKVVTDKCAEVTSWLASELSKLKALPQHADPNITCAQIKAKAGELDKVSRPVMNKKKPAPPKEEKKEEPAKTEETEKKEEETAAPEASANTEAATADDDAPPKMDTTA